MDAHEFVPLTKRPTLAAGLQDASRRQDVIHLLSDLAAKADGRDWVLRTRRPKQPRKRKIKQVEEETNQAGGQAPPSNLSVGSVPVASQGEVTPFSKQSSSISYPSVRRLQTRRMSAPSITQGLDYHRITSNDSHGFFHPPPPTLLHHPLPPSSSSSAYASSQQHEEEEVQEQRHVVNLYPIPGSPSVPVQQQQQHNLAPIDPCQAWFDSLENSDAAGPVGPAETAWTAQHDTRLASTGHSFVDPGCHEPYGLTTHSPSMIHPQAQVQPQRYQQHQQQQQAQPAQRKYSVRVGQELPGSRPPYGASKRDATQQQPQLQLQPPPPSPSTSDSLQRRYSAGPSQPALYRYPHTSWQEEPQVLQHHHQDPAVWTHHNADVNPTHSSVRPVARPHPLQSSRPVQVHLSQIPSRAYTPVPVTTTAHCIAHYLQDDSWHDTAAQPFMLGDYADPVQRSLSWSACPPQDYPTYIDAIGTKSTLQLGPAAAPPPVTSTSSYLVKVDPEEPLLDFYPAELPTDPVDSLYPSLLAVPEAESPPATATGLDDHLLLQLQPDEPYRPSVPQVHCQQQD